MEIGLGLEITLIGMVVVFSTLLVLMGVVTIPRLITSLLTKRNQEVPIQVEEEPAADIPPPAPCSNRCCCGNDGGILPG